MAQDIVGGLFSVNPQQLMQQQGNNEFQSGVEFANLNPNQQGKALGFMAGQQLARGVGGLMGAEDPRLVQARQMDQVKNWIAQSGIDINTPEGLAQAAQYAQSIGATEGAMYLGQQSQQMQKTLVDTRRTEALATREETANAKRDRMEQELQALPPGSTMEDVIGIVTKYGDANTILKEYSDRAQRQAKLESEGGINTAGNPGPMPKGFYRDVDGAVLAPTEMAKQRAGFKGAQELMNELNTISVGDVQNAYSPVGIDWTTKEGWQKKMAGAGTVDAQTKIAVAKLQQVIESLPPGSASDADMRQALSGFPGYGDRVALANWINRAKTKVQYIIDGMSNQFGWKPRTTSSGLLDMGEGNQTIAAPEQQKAPATGGEWRLK